MEDVRNTVVEWIYYLIENTDMNYHDLKRAYLEKYPSDPYDFDQIISDFID